MTQPNEKGPGDVCQGTLEKVELVRADTPREGFLVERAGPEGRGGSAWKKGRLKQWVELPGLEWTTGSGFLRDGEKVEAPEGGCCVAVG